ncbi:nucleotide cyclase [Baffinella frigidus]|nr:nucleotide cyclase [Cryptophyta sp. CCMP2293]
MALLAFRIKEVVETFYTYSGERLSVQAGLNCGPAAGAVVGKCRKFYCIYGDMLNTASRFCSNATRGEVQCSEVYAQRVPRYAASLIRMERLAPVTLKGKGLKEVFLLNYEEDSHRHPFFFERCGEATPKKNVSDQIHKWWCTLLDPDLEAAHQRDSFVATENIQTFLVGLLVLSSTVGITFVHVYWAATSVPVFLLVLMVVVVVTSLFFAILAWREELGHKHLDKFSVALQICCYVTPVLEYFWGDLEVFAFSYFLQFYMPTIIIRA